MEQTLISDLIVTAHIVVHKLFQTLVESFVSRNDFFGYFLIFLYLIIIISAVTVNIQNVNH